MATVTEVEQPSFVKLELRTAYGSVYRDVSTASPRECHADEIPLIDISGIYGDLESRTKLAKQIKYAAENIGFFYIKNHGIPESAIQGALNSSKTFFQQPEEKKQLVSKDKGKYFNGYSAKGTAMASPTEGRQFLIIVPAKTNITDLKQWTTVNPSVGATSRNTTRPPRTRPPSLQT